MDSLEYDIAAARTAIYPESGQGTLLAVLYCALGLAGEAGEVAGTVKKVLRDDGGEITDAARAKLRKEIGDCLWYASRLAAECGMSLDDIMRANVAKLASRQERGALAGYGDDR
jgi:NTP pyrophosphatase (non-canonical NTP hydrolase)